ncbi:murein transglycosylase [Neisseria arctica]|uniref:peptidoglycan lytic exotransglycosylase n=1 Tax=Neisseria arctica TaxID=1470200 RepID=A0A0J0YQ06_9NEIS|nr:murein transglycosylase A [Neisseria arctica]KLT72217.1 murein transglycosylase [Neisseria arctica]UOO86691.1 murein transglycosylase A [Neisseria arctica]
MNATKIIRFSLPVLLTAVLAACSSRPTTPPVVIPPKDTVTVPSTPLPAGTPSPIGYSISPPGSGTTYQVVSHSALPQWQVQRFGQSLRAFRLGCERLKNQADWQNVCAQATQTPIDDVSAKTFFEQYFTPWQVSSNGKLGGTVTGYYEPVLHGDTKQTSKARFPIYGIPSDFVSVDLPANLRGSKATVRIQPTGANSGVISNSASYTANLAEFPITERTRALKGRFTGSRFVPYYTRNQINGGALNGRAPVLGYADDPVELFFLHIQGSGRLKTPDGRYIRLGFADKNEYPYVSIGRYMADKGYLPLAQTTMQGIKAYMQKNPQRLAEVLGQNPSYVFFRELPGNDVGPIGALGVPLLGEYSGAVDRHHITLGAPLFVATTHPIRNDALNRLIMAQDTGSAIKGAVRVDYFWGYGDEAGNVAGKQKHTGYVWQLLPNGVMPQYRP